MDQRAYGFDTWGLGAVKVTTATVFDTGVYLVVVGLVLMILEAFADEAGDGDPDPDPDAPAGPFAGSRAR
jgi:hypothetical protein